jgi:hypothetical protein
MLDIPTNLILAIIGFFSLIGVCMVILGIFLYRRQPTQSDRDYVTQIKRPFDMDNNEWEPAKNKMDAPIEQPFSGSVQKGSGGVLPGQVGDLLKNVLPQQLQPVVFSHRQEPVLPADVNKQLQAALLNGKNHLEDVNYGKIVPNYFIVEVSPQNYEQNYAPIERQAREQWQQRLLNTLDTANGRQGRKVYRFGGPVEVVVRPTADLSENEVRILSQIRSGDAVETEDSPAYLERLPDGQRWLLQPGLTTLGRSPDANIYLDSPVIREKRLISNRHAHIRGENGRYYLFDGSPEGKQSQNGTFVNGRMVSPSGQKLSDGDVVVLAALDVNQPRPDIPGSAGFLFRKE